MEINGMPIETQPPSNPMKVYIAGPMRGIPNWNMDKFAEAEKLWKGFGHHVFSPAQLVKAMGYDTNGSCEPGTKTGLEHLKHVMLSDIACIYACDAVAVIAGWEDSRGSTVEVALAQFLGLPIYCAATMRRLNIVTRPWEFHRQALTKIHNQVETDVLLDKIGGGL